MVLLLFVLFVAVPIVELYVIVQASQSFGILPTIAALVLISIAGSVLVKLEGLGVLRRIQASLADFELPHTELVNGALILFAGALLLTPGFVTDGVGLLLLLPPTRAVVRTALVRRFRSRVAAAAAGPAGAARAWDAAAAAGAPGGGAGPAGPAGSAWRGRGSGYTGRVDVGRAVIVTDARELPGDPDRGAGSGADRGAGNGADRPDGPAGRG